MPQSQPTRLRRFLRLVGVVLVVSLLTFFLEHAGWLKGFETAALDTWLRARFHISEPSESPYINIVGITDNDYEETFEGRSPLDIEALQEIIKAIASVEPAVIGVDIDTSRKDFAQLQTPEGVPVVWAEDVIEKEEGEEFIPLGVLGGREPRPPLSGLALMPAGSDGIIRSYIRKHNGRDSFQWALVKAYCSRLTHDVVLAAVPEQSRHELRERCEEVRRLDSEPDEGEEVDLNLTGDRYRFHHATVREILDPYHGGPNREPLDRLRGKVVLLGGLFRVARDEYVTPLGKMAGVELLGHAVESELEGGGFRRPHGLLMVVFSVLGGIGILLLFLRFRLGLGLLFSLVLIGVIAPLWSYWSYGSFAYTTYFLPVLLAILIHQLYEQAHFYQHKWLHELYSHGEHAGGKIEPHVAAPEAAATAPPPREKQSPPAS